MVGRVRGGEDTAGGAGAGAWRGGRRGIVCGATCCVAWGAGDRDRIGGPRGGCRRPGGRGGDGLKSRAVRGPGGQGGGGGRYGGGRDAGGLSGGGEGAGAARSPARVRRRRTGAR